MKSKKGERSVREIIFFQGRMDLIVLLILTAFSAGTSLICSLIGFEKVRILWLVTILFAVLMLIHAFWLRWRLHVPVKAWVKEKLNAVR